MKCKFCVRARSIVEGYKLVGEQIRKAIE